MTTSNNIIDFDKYYQPPKVKINAEESFPLIYALHSPLGEPLILFRFVKTESENKGLPSADIIPFKQKIGA